MTKFDIDKISFDDEATWNLICEGHTLGMFQCESPLVQQWLKKIKPRNIWELSVVIAGVRPGSLKSGAMDAYAAVKNGEQEPKDYKNPVIKAVLEDTNGQIIFQEQIMCLGSNLAWPDLPEQDRGVKVDTLRKAIGKKNQQKIIEIGKDFVQGCVRNGTSQEIADDLFQVIQNAGRYAFNLSHSISYSHIAYKTAYLKAHYPLQFIATYLSYAREKLDKWEEIKNLVRDSQYFGIKVNPPNINSKNLHFRITSGAIDFGLKHLKFFTSATAKLLEKLPPITDWRQLFSVCFTDTYGTRMNSRTAKAL
jgi:DNA polymerase-3 subunit alpha